MTRKHFEAIAAVLRHTTPQPEEPAYPTLLAQHRLLTKELADTLYSFNGRFDRERFYRAVGLPE